MLRVNILLSHSRSFEMTMLSMAYVSLHQYSIETVSVSRTVSGIFSRDLETESIGRSRSLKMAPFDRSYTNFYWSAIVSIALCCTIFKLFDIEYYRDLEIWVRGHARSSKLVTLKLGQGFLFAFHSNYGRISNRL